MLKFLVFYAYKYYLHAQHILYYGNHINLILLGDGQGYG